MSGSLASAAAVRAKGSKENGGEQRTTPLVAFSWVDFPVTLKATLLGVLPLNSKVAREAW
jgi:hypothetical protein